MNICQLLKSCFPYISPPGDLDYDSDSSETNFRLVLRDYDQRSRYQHSEYRDDVRSCSHREEEELLQHEYEPFNEEFELETRNSNVEQKENHTEDLINIIGIDNINDNGKATLSKKQRSSCPQLHMLVDLEEPNGTYQLENTGLNDDACESNEETDL